MTDCHLKRQVRRMRAVLAEDHPAMAQQLRALISSDCDVRIVQDAQSLMAAFGLEMPDIVIADITMPGNSGGQRPGTSSPRLRKLAKSARTPQKSDGREWWTEHA